MKLNLTYIYTLGLMLVASCAFGQESLNNREVKAKFYTQSSGEFDRNKSSVELFKTFSPSISWGKQYGNFQEIELKDIKLLFSDIDSRIGAGAEYSYNWKILKMKIGSIY